MAKTKADLISKIEDDLTRTDITSQIEDAVDYAIARYKKERFWFNERDNVSVTLSSSVAQLALTALPVQFQKIDRVRVKLNSGDYLDAYPRDRNWIATRQDISITGMPLEYAIYDNALQFDSLADQNYTLVLDGVVDISSQTSVSYSNASEAAWFNEARNLIRADAKRDIYINVLKDFEFAAAMKQVVDHEYSELKAQTNRLLSTGVVRPTRF